MIASERVSIGLVTPAVNGITNVFISHVVKILLALSKDLYLVTANASPGDFDKAHVFSIRQNTVSSGFSRVFSYLWLQIKTAFILARLAGKVDFVIFFLCEEHFLPVLTARLFRKRVVLALGGYTDLELRLQKNAFQRLMKLMRDIDFALAHKILVYSSNVVQTWNLEKYRGKIAVAHEHFLDFNTFSFQKPLEERENVVGYIGRLSEEKGVKNLVEAAPQALKAVKGLKFVLVGEGYLKTDLEQFIGKAGLNSGVELAGWIPHEKIPACLNNFKLLVLPSYTEGLPNIMLEAMACGTPVLATAVGSISQFIEDAQTGYIMENNSPECIARNIQRALNYPGLNQVGLNGKILVENQFTFAEAVKGYGAVIDSVRPGLRNKRYTVENQAS
jgi:glycosyltransferase involved in cell wall biosynthesis